MGYYIYIPAAGHLDYVILLCHHILIGHTHTHIHKIIKLEGHGKRESRKTHSFSVIGYIFEFLFFFFSGTVTIPESYLAKEDSLG